MNVLSLFDGMSCGQIALNRAGVKYDSYFASEIDKYAIKVTQANYPNTIQLGDVTKWREWNLDWSKVGLLIGGSPCQGFSFAGKQLAFDDPRSMLFFCFVDILNHIKKFNPNVKFLLENVKMKKVYKDVITEFLGVEPELIDSAKVSAQTRKRLYWANFRITQPADKNVTWGDIREYDASDNFYYSAKGLQWIKRHSERTGKELSIWGNNEKCQMIETSHYKNYSSQRFFGIVDKKGLRYITPLECERAQTIPDNYTSCVSNTQRYKMAGNGWTVDVITHILSNINE